MIKIENGNLNIAGTPPETVTDLLPVLTGYREMLMLRCGQTPEQANNLMMTLCELSAAPDARRTIDIMAMASGLRATGAEAEKQRDGADAWPMLVATLAAAAIAAGRKGDEPQA